MSARASSINSFLDTCIRMVVWYLVECQGRVVLFRRHVRKRNAISLFAHVSCAGCEQVNRDLADLSRRAKSDYALATDKEAALRSPGRSAWRCCLILQVCAGWGGDGAWHRRHSVTASALGLLRVPLACVHLGRPSCTVLHVALIAPTGSALASHHGALWPSPSHLPACPGGK